MNEDQKATLLRVAIAVFDAYEHRAPVRALARETALVIAAGLRTLHERSELDILLERAHAELVNCVGEHPFAIRNAAVFRDFLSAKMKGLSR